MFSSKKEAFRFTLLLFIIGCLAGCVTFYKFHEWYVIPIAGLGAACMSGVLHFLAKVMDWFCEI